MSHADNIKIYKPLRLIYLNYKKKMKIKPYVEKLEHSKEYRNFKIKYPESQIIAGFFVLDFETGVNIHQIDFYVPKEKKVAAFTLDGGVKLQMLETTGMKNIPEALDINTNIDLDALKGILEDEMKNRNISNEIKKMIAVVQKVKGRKIWNINCVLSGMGILKSHVEDDSQTVLKIEKLSMSDIMKHMPAQPMQMQVPEGKVKKSGVKDELAQIKKIEEELQKEKDRLAKELQKEHSVKAKK